MELRHIALIPDGNRRWARKYGKTLREAYDIGIRKLADFIKWCKKVGAREVTLWGFSTENAKREREEVETIFSLFKYFLDEVLRHYDEIVRKYPETREVAIRFYGRLELFSTEIRKLFRKVESMAQGEKYKVNFLLGYGGRAEIIDAVNKILQAGIKNIDEETLEKYLYLPSEPDLIIRTGGVTRTSGFMIWQSAYSEWYFCKKLWPEFTKEDFMKAIDYYYAQERRFGR